MRNFCRYSRILKAPSAISMETGGDVITMRVLAGGFRVRMPPKRMTAQNQISTMKYSVSNMCANAYAIPRRNRILPKIVRYGSGELKKLPGAGEAMNTIVVRLN